MTVSDEGLAEEELARINAKVEIHSLRAEYLPGISSVGVQGDARSYTRVVVLVGPHPGWKVLAELSSWISNETRVNRVTFEFARKTD